MRIGATFSRGSAIARVRRHGVFPLLACPYASVCIRHLHIHSNRYCFFCAHNAASISAENLEERVQGCDRGQLTSPSCFVELLCPQSLHTPVPAGTRATARLPEADDTSHFACDRRSRVAGRKKTRVMSFRSYNGPASTLSVSSTAPGIDSV